MCICSKNDDFLYIKDFLERNFTNDKPKVFASVRKSFSFVNAIMFDIKDKTFKKSSDVKVVGYTIFFDRALTLDDFKKLGL